MYVVCQKQGCRIELTAPRSLPGSECAPMTAATGYVRVVASAVRLVTSMREPGGIEVHHTLFIVSAYPPTDYSPESAKDSFYDAPGALLRQANSSYIVVAVGDTNVHVGRLSAAEAILGDRLGLDTRRSDNGVRICTSIEECVQHQKLRWLGHVLRMPNHRLPKRVLFSMPNSEWRKQRGGQPLTWQRSMKEITKRLGAVGATRLPGWGPRDPHCAWLETLQDMAANRCQWRSCCQFLSRLPDIGVEHWCHAVDDDDGNDDDDEFPEQLESLDNVPTNKPAPNPDGQHRRQLFCGEGRSPPAAPSGTSPWIPIMQLYGVAFHRVRKSRTPRLAIEKLVDPEVQRIYQNQFLKHLLGGTMSDINSHWGKISKALLKAGMSVCGTSQPISSKHRISDGTVFLLETRYLLAANQIHHPTPGETQYPCRSLVDLKGRRNVRCIKCWKRPQAVPLDSNSSSIQLANCYLQSTILTFNRRVDRGCEAALSLRTVRRHVAAGPDNLPPFVFKVGGGLPIWIYLGERNRPRQRVNRYWCPLSKKVLEVNVVNTEAGGSVWRALQKLPYESDVTQGYPLAPFLFNFIDEMMRRTLDHLQNASIQTVAGENIVNLKCANDITLIFEDQSEAKVLLNRLTTIIPSFVMRLAPSKCKVMLQNVQSAKISLTIQGEDCGSVAGVILVARTPRLLSMGEISTSTGSTVDPEVLEIQKKLYKEQLIRQAIAKKGSKYYPVNIEPTPLERDRLALPFNDQDRALRKQWLDDLVLSEREPVAVPEWTRVNIFRRAYRKPFDVLADLVKPVIGPTSARYFRWTLHKFTLGLLAGWVIWYKAKYAPKGQPGFPDNVVLTREFAMEDFERRTALKGDKLPLTWPVSGSPSRKTAATSAAEFAGNGFHTSLNIRLLLQPVFLNVPGYHSNVYRYRSRLLRDREKAHVFLDELTKDTPSFGMNFAPTQCKVMLLDMKSLNTPLTIQGGALEVVERFRYLGSRVVSDEASARVYKAWVAFSNLRHSWHQSGRSLFIG
ncbi:LOW QUALITY PROTEIN: hypothetical protein T265_13500 [Opisthorchis viverrini]|uniref:Uncharacterized protein n=1 Tax=Opisthorchis viverrini TaxID=6198 RepID=A0A074ZNE4_OPIVI|nr:LOW QUALITY PROTEIN: hypothetical protein T265_13500 [Opisthorchis viverrini]KER28918.1 LOW QUALITY PROTEIN: hypothetical protein T265_13500 [Opisthorchis viverrini]